MSWGQPRRRACSYRLTWRKYLNSYPYTYVNRKGQTSIPHRTVVTLQNGRPQRIYRFAREARRGDAMDTLPVGHEVVENERTGLPMVRRKG